MGKEVKVLWLSQEEVIEAGAMNMEMIMKQVEKVNIWLTEEQVVESNLFRLVWDKKLGSSRKIGLHAALIRNDEMQVAGVKGIPSNPDNPKLYGMPRSNGILIMYHEKTGFPFAVMDDKIVSDMRTGAGSALGAKLCANPDSEIMAIIGCGPIANAHINATNLVMKNIKTVRLYDLNEAKANDFAEKWAKLGYKFEICKSCETAMSDADIVYTCTTNIGVGDEYIPKEWVKKGSFHSPASIWDYKPETVLTAFNKYAMDFEGRLEDKGFPFADHVMAGTLKREDLKVAGRLLRGLEQCRTSPNDTVYYCTLGICATDLAVNWLVYNKARELGLGTEVYLWKEPAYF